MSDLQSPDVQPVPEAVEPTPEAVQKKKGVNPILATVIILLAFGAVYYFYDQATQTPRHILKTIKHS